MHDFNERTDRDLVDAANEGDADAMAELYVRYRNWVITVAYSFCRNQEDAQDVLQETFKYFFDRFPDFELRSSLKTFLYPVIRSRAIDIIRYNQRQLPVGDDTLESTFTSTMTDHDVSRQRVSEMVCQLPEEQQDVVILRYVDGCSMKDIAGKLDIPEGTVKSRLHHALVTLKRLFLTFFIIVMNLLMAHNV